MAMVWSLKERGGLPGCPDVSGYQPIPVRCPALEPHACRLRPPHEPRVTQGQLVVVRDFDLSDGYGVADCTGDSVSDRAGA